MTLSSRKEQSLLFLYTLAYKHVFWGWEGSEWNFPYLACSSRTDGYLFDKESVLEYIITKKNENSRKMKEYEKQKRMQENEQDHKVQEETRAKVSKFVKMEKDITVKSTFETKSNQS